MKKPELFQGGQRQRSEHYGSRRYRFYHGAAKLGMRALGAKVEGLENIEPLQNNQRGSLVVPDHQHLLDIPLLTLAGFDRRLSFMGKRELWDDPRYGFIIRELAKEAGAFPVVRHDPESRSQALNTAVEKLNNRELVIMYPKGTRENVAATKVGASVAASRAEGETLVLPTAQGYRQTNEGKLIKRRASLVIGESFVVNQGDPIDEVHAHIDSAIAELRIRAIDLAHEQR